MKRNCLSIVFITALVLATMLSAPRAQADDTLHMDVQMTNVLWAPESGTLNWLSPWEVEAAASIFDSQNGFTNGYQFQMGQPATVAASAATPLMAAGSGAEVDAAGNIVSLWSSLGETVSPGVTLTAFSASTAYREFEITGGTGPVAVNFGFDYSGLFQSTADAVNAGYGLNYMASLRISDGVNQWEFMASDTLGTSTNQPFGGTLSESFTLQYDTPYSITLIKDGETTPEPNIVPLLVLGIVLCAGWHVLKARGYRKEVVTSDAGRT